jgi:NTP pyrophosphatase (non-canonical NTP hydrolase)
VSGLTFAEISAINRQRCDRWHDGFPNHEDDWTGADWSNAMQGEAGEAGNVVKKLRRQELSTPGNRGDDLGDGVLLNKLAAEIADTFIYLDLLATYYGIDLEQAVIDKFNEVSEREGFPEMIR